MAETLITNGSSQLLFKEEGFKVLSLILADHVILGTVTRGDNTVASTHPCGPNFDEDTSGRGLPRHGILRRTQATLRPRRPEDGPSIRAAATIVLDGYPEGVECVQTYSLGRNSVIIDTGYLNYGDEPAPVNHGNHLYFNAPQGWEGARLNGQPLNARIRNDAIFPWRDVNGLYIPGQPRMLLIQENLPYANPWTWTDDAGTYDNHYFSLSSIQGNPRTGYFGSEDSLVLPNQSGMLTRLIISLAPQEQPFS